MRTRGQDPTLPEMRRVRLLEMADAMDMFCQGLVCAFTGGIFSLRICAVFHTAYGALSVQSALMPHS